MRRGSSRVAGLQRTAPQTLELRPQVICLLAGCVQHESPPGYPLRGCMPAAKSQATHLQDGVSYSQELQVAHVRN